ncbi:hypothetical protein D018_3588A, partial [Vibrio parahaemolyticus VP2007-007]
MGNYREPLYL